MTVAGIRDRKGVSGFHEMSFGTLPISILYVRFQMALVELADYAAANRSIAI